MRLSIVFHHACFQSATLIPALNKVTYHHIAFLELELIHLLNASEFVFICKPDYWTTAVGKGCCFSFKARQKAGRRGGLDD